MSEPTADYGGNVSPARGLPATSLIICSRNRPELLLASVESIMRGDHVPTELVIVDQSDVPQAAPATLDPDRACEVRYLWTRSVGSSRARNAGIAAAKHDLLVFTDDDVLVTPAWFGAIVRALLDAEPRSVVTGQVLPTEVKRPGGFVPSIKVDNTPAAYEGRISQDPLYPLSMAIYRSAIDEVGGFDERLGPGTPFPAAEDNDVGFRLLETGYRIVYVPQAILYHRAWRAKQDYLPLQWRYGRGQGAFYAKYLSLRDRFMLRRLGGDVVYHCQQFAGRGRCQRHLASGDIVYAFGVLAGAGQWLLTKRKRQRPTRRRDGRGIRVWSRW